MKNEFEIGDYVYAEGWCYGKIVYIDNKYAEVDFDTMRGGGCRTFLLEDLQHSEKPKRRLNYGQGDKK
jgi:hypothetical protein